jgi:hypothetical protein
MATLYYDSITIGPANQRKRKPTLTSVAGQASKAGITVARYEVDVDGKIIVVPGAPDTGPSQTSNEWDTVQ